jgi:hypothetical protein
MLKPGLNFQKGMVKRAPEQVNPHAHDWSYTLTLLFMLSEILTTATQLSAREAWIKPSAV